MHLTRVVHKDSGVEFMAIVVTPPVTEIARFLNTLCNTSDHWVAPIAASDLRVAQLGDVIVNPFAETQVVARERFGKSDKHDWDFA